MLKHPHTFCSCPHYINLHTTWLIPVAKCRETSEAIHVLSGNSWCDEVQPQPRHALQRRTWLQTPDAAPWLQLSLMILLKMVTFSRNVADAKYHVFFLVYQYITYWYTLVYISASREPTPVDAALPAWHKRRISSPPQFFSFPDLLFHIIKPYKADELRIDAHVFRFLSKCHLLVAFFFPSQFFFFSDYVPSFSIM